MEDHSQVLKMKFFKIFSLILIN